MGFEARSRAFRICLDKTKFEVGNSRPKGTNLESLRSFLGVFGHQPSWTVVQQKSQRRSLATSSHRFLGFEERGQRMVLG